jgi:hypothetical protein
LDARGEGEQFDTRKWEGIGEILTQCQNRSFKMGHVDIYPKYHFSPPIPPILPPQIPQIRPPEPQNRTPTVPIPIFNPLFPLTRPPPPAAPAPSPSFSIHPHDPLKASILPRFHPFYHPKYPKSDLLNPNSDLLSPKIALSGSEMP